MIPFIFQATLIKVLEYHAEWLEEIGFSHNQVHWLQTNLYSSNFPSLLLEIMFRQAEPFRNIFFRAVYRADSKLTKSLEEA